MGALRPGELKILAVLMTKGPQTYSELRKETQLQFNVLSDYLKDLQTPPGLIERDVDDRKYRIKGRISIESMFFNDVQEFLRDRMDRMLIEGKERANVLIADAFGSLILTESTEMRRRLEKGTTEIDYRESFRRISEFVMSSGDSYVLAKFTKGEQEIINTYKRFLLECVKKLSRTENNKLKGNALFKIAAMESKARMESGFPGVQIPKEMIEIEARRWLAQIKEAQDHVLQPNDLDDLKNRVFRGMQATGDLQENLAKKDSLEVKTMLGFLEDSRHRKIYERYRDQIRNEPKTVVLITSFGFKGYMRKLKEWFPEETEARSREIFEAAMSKSKEFG